MNSATKTPFSLLVLILLIGAGLRFHALAYNERLHPDEALFATFARNASVHGDWMLSGPLDKSPLSIYFSALSMHFTSAYVNELGVIDVPILQGEFSAKLPNVLAGIILIAIVYRLALALFQNQQTALLSALFIALSPYLIEYNASVFTDTLMLMFMVASLLAIQTKKNVLSGFLLALSVASKQQGIYYLPLVLGLIWLHKERRWHNTFRFVMALIFGISLLLFWDSARHQTSIFALASANNSPNGLLPPLTALPERLETWLRYLSESFGAWWLSILILICGVYSVIVGIAPPLRLRGGGWGVGSNLTSRSLSDCKQTRWGLGLILIAYCTAYITFHWLINFNIYNRYLLPLIPLLSILCAQRLIRLWQSRFNRNQWISGAFLLILLIGTLGIRTDIGRDRDNPDGIIKLATFINDQPLGTIVYNHWLGWEMGYYLGAWTDKRIVYYPTSKIFAEDASSNPELAPRYLIAPEGIDVQAWLTNAQNVGFHITLVYHQSGFLAYELSLSSDSGASASSSLPSESTGLSSVD